MNLPGNLWRRAARTRSNFGAEHGDGYMGFFPPGGALDATVPAGSDIATLTVSAGAFQEALDRHFPEMPDAILAQGAGMRIGPHELAGLHSILS